MCNGATIDVNGQRYVSISWSFPSVSHDGISTVKDTSLLAGVSPLFATMGLKLKFILCVSTVSLPRCVNSYHLGLNFHGVFDISFMCFDIQYII